MTYDCDDSTPTETANATADTSSFAGNVIGLWEFDDGCSYYARDTGLDDGVAQNGTYENGANDYGGWLTLDGYNDRVDVDGKDTPFDLSAGTIQTRFIADGSYSKCGGTQLEGGTLVNRGEYADRYDEGYFGLSTTASGAVMVEHYAAGASVTLSTQDGFYAMGDEVTVTYSWDADGGATLIVLNATTGQTAMLSDDTVTGLTLDIGDNDDENFTFGAREVDDGKYDDHFDGKIAFVAVYDQPVAAGDGFVEGTAGDDLIDAAYTGDPEEDMIDAGDAILPGEAPDDDIVLAGDGNDTVLAGEGDDEVYAGTGIDEVEGGTGDDLIYGGSGADILDGQAGNDTIFGDGGNAPTIATITFESEDAGYLNTMGVYTIDPDTGAITNVEIAFENTSAIGSGGNLTQGDSYTYVTGPGAQVGVFLIADGYDLNDYAALGEGSFLFLDASGNPATLDTPNPSLVFVAEDGTQTALSGEIFHTAAHGTNLGLNPDGLLHTAGYSENPDGSVTLGFEDINGLGDQDYDDPVFTVAIEGAGGSLNNAHFDLENPADILTEGDDSLIGGDGADVIYGGGGNDTIHAGSGLTSQSPDLGYPGLFDADTDPEDDRDYVDGGDGNDLITTGDDADTIYGGTGNDTIDAGVDADEIHGGAGDDSIIGGEGSDTIAGGAGDDTIYGGLDPAYPDSLNIPDNTDLVPDNGRDLIDGGDGNDLIYGQDDDDTIYGGAGNDTIDAGIDDDYVDGGEGADVIYSGAGSDTIEGGDGDDTIHGGGDNDVLSGGADRDIFYIDSVGMPGGSTNTTVHGGNTGVDWDTLNLSALISGGWTITHLVKNPDGDPDGLGWDGQITLQDGGGQYANINFTNIEEIIPCFTPGTLIATPKGERPVEELREGDKVITRDNGIQEIRWIGTTNVSSERLAHDKHLMPVLIRAGALGHGLPERDMLVSPQHRVLVANDRTALYFEEREVLVAAKHLVNNRSIQRVAPRALSYLHFMFDQHEVVLSDGAWTESFQPGDYTLGGMGNAQRGEIFELFPELQTEEGLRDYVAARRTLRRHEAVLLGSEF
ncbi:intein [Rhodovulum bhavnagarense]|uniref:Intein n=1 Tax=Rhodovulum bhavnagarense TaxID=992286 RepID=A0A4R2RH27_9RHOB|nr:Hint domain-containing protein [Rhodovulum bhavnagarense]TCP61417.1 intein [Rhodovulum bhavnagarense]